MNTARLVVLGIAVVAGGLAALLASGDREEAPPPPPVAAIETVDILVASADIGLGDTVNEKTMGWQTWPTAAAGPSFIRKTDKPNAIQELAGSMARQPFARGEPIREAKLINAKGSGYMAAILPSGMRAFATRISTETGAGGFILPNDHVDVILSRRDAEAEKMTGASEVFVSETVLSNVRVLAIDQLIEEKDGKKVAADAKTATLALTPDQVETLTRAQQLGRGGGGLSLALRSLADFNAPGTAVSNDDRSSINMVRFGVTTTAVPK